MEFAYALVLMVVGIIVLLLFRIMLLGDIKAVVREELEEQDKSDGQTRAQISQASTRAK